jgi:hypothetical protein
LDVMEFLVEFEVEVEFVPVAPYPNDPALVAR